MSAIVNLDNVADGFSAPAQDAQTSYRAILRAMTRPGLPVVLDEHAGLDGVNSAAASVLLTLLDFDTLLYLDAPYRGGPIPNWVRFHTNSQITENLSEADFALLAAAPGADVLSRARQGDPKYPDRSATFILQVPSLTGGEAKSLEGPGIDGSVSIAVDGLDADFWHGWQLNTRRFPLGVDVLICAGSQVMGLPRTSRPKTDA